MKDEPSDYLQEDNSRLWNSGSMSGMFEGKQEASGFGTK